MRRIIGQVSGGKFIDGKPKEINNREHSLHRQFVRDDMRNQYKRDITQPWRNGKANPEYIKAFGKKEATNYFSESQIKEAMDVD